MINIKMSLFTVETVEEVKRLIDLGHDVNSVDHYGKFPLHCACEKGNLEIVKVLCKAGIDVNKRYSDDYPIDKAINAGHLDIIKYLIENYPVKLENVLYRASIAGNIDVLDYLLTLNLELNSSHKNPLITACRSGHIDVIDRLLYAGVDTNIVDYGRTALKVAIIYNKLDIVKRLVMFGANYHCDDGLSLLISCDYSYDEISEFLIDLGCDINYCSRNMTSLMHACQNNNLKIVKLLLEHGADPNFICDGKKAVDYCVSDEVRALFIKN